MITLLISLAMSSAVMGLEVRGTATDLEGSKVLYTEVHAIKENEKKFNESISSRYLKPDGTLFAQMSTDFSKSQTLPTIVFEDFRFKTKQELTWEPDGKAIKFKVSGLEADNKIKPKEKRFVVNKEMVAGQGFDNFIRMNFEKISESKVPLSFGVLSELDFFSFNAIREKASASSPAKFGIRLRNPFLRLFVHDLEIEYNETTRRILSYRGLSNLLSDEGKSMNVLIKYEDIKQ